MSELKTDAAEQALSEHVAAVRGESPDRGTAYHESVEDFRRELVKSSLMWDKLHSPYWDATYAYLVAKRAAVAGSEPVRPDQAIFDADAASMMASSYAYTLAAVIALAQKNFGDEVAQALASVADDLLINGDDDPGWNADVMPPSATEGATDA